MKLNKYYIGLAFLPMLASCADYLDTNNYVVEKPASIAEFEYLNDYKPLKEYVNRAAHPGFTLGSGVSVDDYLKQGSTYIVSNTNFDMLTAGNAMKYASVVSDKGIMNFDKVVNFIEAAENAGMQVYGHTLCWHSQQNLKWLNKLIADKEIPIDPNSANSFLTYTCGDPGENSWDKQAIYTLPKSMVQGNNYSVKVKIKGSVDSGDTVVGLWPIWDASENKNQWGGSNDVQYLEEKGFGGEWMDFEWKFDASFPHDKLQFTFGKHGGFVSFDDLCVIDNTTGEELLSVIDFSDGKAPNWGNNWNGPTFAIEQEGTGMVEYEDYEERECLQIITQDKVEHEWDSQFWLYFPGESFNVGDTYEVSMDVRALKNASIGTQTHKDPGGYIHWAAIGNVPFSTEWENFQVTGKFDNDSQVGGYSIAFNLNDFAGANEYYLDNISFKLNGRELVKNGSCDKGGSVENFRSKEWPSPDIVDSRLVTKAKIMKKGNTIPLTPEEKEEILTAELERWIKGMVTATQGKVKAWDVVNEPLSDQNNCVDLKHKAVEADPQSFYWQDYLGDDYVRLAVKYAREAYADIDGTNPDDLKLFVNDYGLEGNGSVKVESLINWINRWESDGVTKIDGIGTQMHVTYATDPEAQARNEQGVVDMLKKLAATGKLIRITELDMGIKSGDHWSEEGRKTETLTVEEHKAMGEYYRFIVNQYFKLIPEAQQFGICHWSQTDSPENSGWRKGEPIGLWNLNTQRKPAYGGFADGLGEN